MISFLKTIIYIPLYNLLMLVLHIPHIDAGVAAIILVILVKLLLYPLAKKTYLTQLKMKGAGAELALIKEKYKNREEQAAKVMEFYKKNKINPFGSILSLLIQIPIIYSLYYMFIRSGLPMVDTSILYSFISAPSMVSMSFLGLIDISQKSIVFAALAAISSFAQMHYAGTSPAASNVKDGGKEDLSSMMSKQMKYTMPIIIFLISWRISAILSLYWFTSNVVSMAQDYFVRKHADELLSSVPATQS